MNSFDAYSWSFQTQSNKVFFKQYVMFFLFIVCLSLLWAEKAYTVRCISILSNQLIP